MVKCKTCGAPVDLAPDGDPKYKRPPKRADLHAELMRAADDLVDAVDQERNMVCQDLGMQLKSSEVVGVALTAYQQAKEKTNAL